MRHSIAHLLVTLTKKASRQVFDRYVRGGGEVTSFRESVAVILPYLCKKTLYLTENTILISSVFENLYERSFLTI